MAEQTHILIDIRSFINPYKPNDLKTDVLNLIKHIISENLKENVHFHVAMPRDFQLSSETWGALKDILQNYENGIINPKILALPMTDKGVTDYSFKSLSFAGLALTPGQMIIIVPQNVEIEHPNPTTVIRLHKKGELNPSHVEAMERHIEANGIESTLTILDIDDTTVLLGKVDESRCAKTSSLNMSVVEILKKHKLEEVVMLTSRAKDPDLLKYYQRNYASATKLWKSLGRRYECAEETRKLRMLNYLFKQAKEEYEDTVTKVQEFQQSAAGNANVLLSLKEHGILARYHEQYSFVDNYNHPLRKKFDFGLKLVEDFMQATKGDVTVFYFDDCLFSLRDAIQQVEEHKGDRRITLFVVQSMLENSISREHKDAIVAAVRESQAVLNPDNSPVMSL